MWQRGGRHHFHAEQGRRNARERGVTTTVGRGRTVAHDPNTLTRRNLATMFWAPFGIDRLPSPWGKQHG